MSLTCPNGHEWRPETTRFSGPWRYCVLCEREKHPPRSAGVRVIAFLVGVALGYYVVPKVMGL